MVNAKFTFSYAYNSLELLCFCICMFVMGQMSVRTLIFTYLLQCGINKPVP